MPDRFYAVDNFEVGMGSPTQADGLPTFNYQLSNYQLGNYQWRLEVAEPYPSSLYFTSEVSLFSLAKHTTVSIIKRKACNA